MAREIEGANEIAGMIKGLEMGITNLENNPPPFKSDRFFWEAIKGYYERIHQANLSDQPLVASGMFVPTELYTAMDIAHFLPEYHSILMTASAGQEIFRYMDIAEGSYGLSNEICSPHRIAIGLAKLKMVPRPKFAVSTPASCDQTLKLYENLANLYGIPAFLYDSPYGFAEREIKYGKVQVRRMIEFLEQQTGRKMDYDRLKEVVKLSCMAYDYWERNCELRKSIPCPIGSRDGIKDFGILLTSGGTPQGVKYFEERYKDIKARVDNKIGVIPDEKHRIAWLYVLPLFDLGIADWMEEEFKAVIVMDTISMASSDIELDPSDPIEYLATKLNKLAFLKLTYGDGGVTGFSREMARQVNAYHANIAMMLAHWSCRQYCGTIKLLRDDVTREAGVPFFVIDGDILDSRVVSSAQMKAKIAEFFKTIN